MMIGTSGRIALALGRSSRPLIPGMLMSDGIRIRDFVPSIRNALNCHRRRLRKFHREATGAKFAPELLAEQRLDIRLVIDHENEQGQVRSPGLLCDAPVRGRTILNSVNAQGAVSTSMMPPCCFTMMSWLIDRPSPVPSPAGLVVKKGLNIFSFASPSNSGPVSRYQPSTAPSGARGGRWVSPSEALPGVRGADPNR